jgi:GDP/UDP-N,N'-diacetylbacillosamine 2-epimerase (hydrolysing)
MRRIGVVTFARSDYSSCLPVLRAIKADADLDIHLIVAGMHLSPEFGYTIKEIEKDGFEINDRVEMLLSSDTPEGVAKSIGLGTIGFAQSFARVQPDLLLLVGDRSELLSVASAALPFRIPLAHISGGDITEGAIDNQVRYAISMLSHLHFVSMQAHADRLLQMGEESWRVVITGDPALDLIPQMQFLDREELSRSLGIELSPPILLITFHPTTQGSSSVTEELTALLFALNRIQGTLIFTYPNADTGSRMIIEHIRNFVEHHPNAFFVFNLGQLRYYSLLSHVNLMVGNSSSGIWESPSFCLPAINIGERQKGRFCAANVINVPAEAEVIYQGICRGLDATFRASLRGMKNPYGDGHASAHIIDMIKRVELGTHFLQKRFQSKIIK